MSKFMIVHDFYKQYKVWVSRNPTVVADVETVLTWSSYFVAGKINKSPVLSELVYTTSKLFTLFNDQIIQETYGGRPPSSDKFKDRLKIFLTIVHYCEVFVELVVRKQFSYKGKWTAATLLQVLKCVSSLILLYRFKEVPISHPPIAMLQRKQVLDADVENSNSFVLKRSGRLMRRVEGAPPIALRTWQPLTNEKQPVPNEFMKKIMLAETVHILKPLLHLASIGLCGSKDWKQWFVSMFLDILSLKLYSKNISSLNYEQRLELSRRKLVMLLYLLRSPMFEIYSRRVIFNSLTSVSNRIPITSLLCNPIMQYLNHWQDIYFYMWTQ